jgi:flagellin
MAFNINTNPAAAKAGFYLSRNNENLNKSMARLASGKRVLDPSDDAGGLAVAMKLQSAATRLGGTRSNIQNAVSYLEVQDGVLETIGELVDRMSEIRALANDVMKNDEDIKTYNREFQDLQVQLFDMASESFNGVSLFSRTTEKVGGDEVLFEGSYSQDHTMNLYISEDGESGPIVSIHKSMLLSALTVSISSGSPSNAMYSTADQSTVLRFANPGLGGSGSEALLNLADVSVGVFKQVLQNIAALRSQNGATMSRLDFSGDHVERKRNNMISAHSKIMDVDMAAESTNLAKYNVLVQSSASMLTQANMITEMALVLIR